MSVSEGRKGYDGEGGRGPGGAGGRRPRGRGGERDSGPRARRRDGGREVDASRLPEELRALGRSLDAADGAEGSLGSETMVERVLGQILTEQLAAPVPEPRGPRERLRAVRRWTRVRWRSLTATLCGLLTVLALTPPVRAAVYDWFDFGGVEVRYDPSAHPSPGAEVPGCGRSVSWAQAVRRAGFEPLVPDALGAPDAMSVAGGPQGRFVVSLCWRESGGTVRVDEFAAGLDLTFAKTGREKPEWISLSGSAVAGSHGTALWFPRPHLLSFWLLDADGKRYTRQERTAGPTLLWSRPAGSAEVTLRLEGVASKARALEIAKSVTSPVAESSGASSD
ncbi:hypothetical protein AQJ23_13980 [Streptomyces antibioticus]|nr:hypothetical protein [Streptomyces antibioticus]KUN26283.1 hypothetical protein AQJ23_13980 [Streptomyces antibioticus]